MERDGMGMDKQAGYASTWDRASQLERYHDWMDYDRSLRRDRACVVLGLALGMGMTLSYPLAYGAVIPIANRSLDLVPTLCIWVVSCISWAAVRLHGGHVASTVESVTDGVFAATLGCGTCALGNLTMFGSPAMPALACAVSVAPVLRPLLAAPRGSRGASLGIRSLHDVVVRLALVTLLVTALSIVGPLRVARGTPGTLPEAERSLEANNARLRDISARPILDGGVRSCADDMQLMATVLSHDLGIPVEDEPVVEVVPRLPYESAARYNHDGNTIEVGMETLELMRGYPSLLLVRVVAHEMAHACQYRITAGTDGGAGVTALHADDARIELWRREQEGYGELVEAVGHDALDIERSAKVFELYSYLRFAAHLKS